MALALFAALAVPVRGRRLLEIEGVELRGVTQLALSGGGTCNVLESDTSYEARKENHGAPMDIWRLDFSVHNRSGRWLDHLIARFQIESVWPECTNWDVPEAGKFAQPVEWADSIGHVQESGRNVVAPGQTLTLTKLFIVLRGDPEPRFENWSMDFDFAVAPPPAAGSSATVPTLSAEQDMVFWQSIMNSADPADFEAYLRQFPQGVFRALAQNRLAALDAPGSDLSAANRSSPEAESQAGHLETPQPICQGERKWDDPPCWMELASHRGCYVWDMHSSVAALSMNWTGRCANGRAEGSGTLEWIQANSFTYPQRATGLLRGGKRTGRWTYRFAANWVSQAPYVDGKKHGMEVDRGASYGTVITTPWVDGKIHGTVVERNGEGDVVGRTEFVNGVEQK